MKEWFYTSFGLWQFVRVFSFLDLPKILAKRPRYRSRRPQDSRVAPLNPNQYFPAIAWPHVPYKLQAVQETSQP